MPVESFSTRLCGCSFIHPGCSLHEGLEVVHRLGFSSVDIGVGGGNNHYDAMQVAQAPIHFADEVRRETEHFALTPNECFALNFGKPINSPDLNDRKDTLRLFAGLCCFAQLARFKSILLIPGPVYAEFGQCASLEFSALALNDLVCIADEYNLQLNIEADYESCANTPEAARELCERVPGLGLTLDYSHFIYQDIAQERIAVLHPYTRHIHIRQAAPEQIVTDVEQGSINYELVIKQLEESGYNGLYCIEYLSLDARKSTFGLSEARTRAMSCEIENHLQSIKAEL